MLNIYTSNDLETLFEQFLNNIENNVEKQNPYEPYYVLIPNKNIEYWLKQKIAEKNQICMNFEFYFFEEGITKIFNQSLPNINTIDLVLFSLIIYQIFLENSEDFEIFKNFLDQHKSQRGNVFDLSYHLSEIMLRYFYHNPVLIDYFNDKITESNIELNQTLKQMLLDQKKLYKKFKEKIEKLNSEQTQKFFLFCEYPWEKELPNLKKKLSIFIFAFQYNNYFYYKLLKTLKDKIDIYYYQLLLLNPQKLKEQDIKDSAQKISINNLQLLNEITSVQPKYLSSKLNRKKNLLQELQTEFLEKGILETFNKPKSLDKSLQLIEAPEKKAEIKAILYDIQEELIKNNELKLNEIAILSPNLEKYLPILVGYLDTLNIPYNIQDPTQHKISYFASALESVFLILDSLSNQKISFSNEQILSILENPLFQKTHKISQDDVSIFYKLIQILKIYFDDEREPYHSWEIAIKRLRAGKFTDQILTYNNFLIFPFFDFEIKLEIIEKLHSSILQLIKELKEIHHFMIHENKEIESFYNKLDLFFQKHFNIHMYKENIFIEKKSYKEFQNRLYYLKLLKITPSADFLHNYFKLTSYKIPSKINEYLFHGISISSLKPLRPIPFKKIYIIGLNQEEFSEKKINSIYDLIDVFLKQNQNQKRLFDNIISPQDKNLFLFYEIFLSARESLVLSYVNKDLQNNKNLYPSYIFEKIKKFLDKSNLTSTNYIKIPYTIKINQHKKFNLKFEFYLSLIANFRKDLNQLREFLNKNQNLTSNQRDERFLNFIISSSEDSIKDLYVQKKFIPDCLSFPIENKRIPIKEFIEFQEQPIQYYFKKHQLLSNFSNETEVIESMFKYDLDKRIKQEIIKKIFLEFIFNSNTTNIKKIIKKTLNYYKIQGLLTYTSLENRIKEDMCNLFTQIEKPNQTSNISKTKRNVFYLEELKNIYKKFYKNYLYLNPYKKFNFDLEKEVRFPNKVLEIPAYSFDNYLFESYLQKDLIIDLENLHLYFFSFYDFEHSFINYFYLFSLKEIFKDFEFFYLFFDLRKEMIYKKELKDFESKKQQFEQLLREMLERNNLKFYNFFTIESKEQFLIKKQIIDFEDILKQKESLLQLVWEEILLLNLQKES